MSKRGGHLWIFLATPLLAKECRIYIHDLALRLGVPVKGSGLAEGIEVFPKHDAIGAESLAMPFVVRWESTGRQPPILVLWRRLHAGRPDRLP